jgi:hypothetical protein
MARGWSFSAVALGGMCAAVAMVANPAIASEEAPAPRVYLSDGVARALVARAVAGARRRLDQPACGLVFSDFTDASGRQLSDALADAGTPAAAYIVERIWFVDGGDAAACRDDESTAAFTAAGSKVVHVCAARFAALARRSTTAEMLVIHEVLHTLGLGENPPSSAEITREVTKRCGGS